MVRATFHGVFFVLVLGIAELGIFSKAENRTWTCEEGWASFDAKHEISCVVARPGKGSFRDADRDCASYYASLVSIHSKEKDDFVLDLMRVHQFDSVVLGLTTTSVKSYNELVWFRRDGNEKMDYSNIRYTPSYDGTRLCTWKVQSGGQWIVQTCDFYSRYAFFCEKRPICAVGTFGRLCDKQCHCHGQFCDPRDLTGACPFGCERGWMGIGCDKRKEDADVTYYCVNSKDHGTYVSIMIDTKGVNYRNIHGLDAQGKPAPWCNDTALIIGRPKDFVDIKIFKTKATKEGLDAGVCAGKIIDENTYQWTLVIQERKGILMDNDQSLLITCNFSQAETLTRDGHDDIEEENETPLYSLQETREDVRLEVADAFTGEVLTQTKTGSPVRLQMCFGLQKGSLVKGVVPYNCEAVSGDGKHRQPLLNRFGCQESDLVSSFHKSNHSHIIQTDWFPFFGFEGSSVVQLQCSFTFCFVECETGCDHFGENSSQSRHRLRRDTQSQGHKDLYHSVVRRIEITPVRVAEAKGHDLPMKPVVTVSKDKGSATESESEASSYVQWYEHNWFFVLFTVIIIIVVLVVYIISMWSVHSSIKSIRREITSTFYRDELIRVSCRD